MERFLSVHVRLDTMGIRVIKGYYTVIMGKSCVPFCQILTSVMPTLVKMMGHVNNTPSERLSVHVWLVTTEIRVKMVSSSETNEFGWSASYLYMCDWIRYGYVSKGIQCAKKVT